MFSAISNGLLSRGVTLDKVNHYASLRPAWLVARRDYRVCQRLRRWTFARAGPVIILKQVFHHYLLRRSYIFNSRSLRDAIFAASYIM